MHWVFASPPKPPEWLRLCIERSGFRPEIQQLLLQKNFRDEAEYEATAGGGMVSVKVSGKRELTAITIDPQVVDPDDIEMLQDLVMAAVNEALRKGEEARETAMNRMAPGMGGLF